MHQNYQQNASHLINAEQDGDQNHDRSNRLGVKSSFTGYVTGPGTDWVGLGFDKI